MLWLGPGTETTWFAFGKHHGSALNICNWQMKMVRLAVRNSQFWLTRNSWKCPQVSLKKSCGVTRVAVDHLAAWLTFVPVMSHVWSKCLSSTFLWFAETLTNIIVTWWLGCMWRKQNRCRDNCWRLQIGSEVRSVRRAKQLNTGAGRKWSALWSALRGFRLPCVPGLI